jgi:hypothetical protein
MWFRVDDEEPAMEISQKFCRLASRRIRETRGRKISRSAAHDRQTALVLYVFKNPCWQWHPNFLILKGRFCRSEQLKLHLFDEAWSPEVTEFPCWGIGLDPIHRNLGSNL